RNPASVALVLTGPRLGGVEHGHLEVQDHVVRVVADVLGPAHERADQAGEPGFLLDLAHERLRGGLAALDVATGERPAAGRRTARALDHQECAVADRDRPDAHARAVTVGHGRTGSVSDRWVTIR